MHGGSLSIVDITTWGFPLRKQRDTRVTLKYLFEILPRLEIKV